MSRTQLWRIETCQAPLSLEHLLRCIHLLQTTAARLVPSLCDDVSSSANDYDYAAVKEL